jgi:S-formylglutathione hydrolase
VSALELISKNACCGGEQRFYRHESRETGGPMKFGVFMPPQARSGAVPVLYFLAGLTCTEETFCIKAHAQAAAAELGLMLITPDTSPREPRIPGDADAWDFGFSAGFYLDATMSPWARNYRMYSYITSELPRLVAANLPARAGGTGICGHSMGGHGALTLGLRNPEIFRSISAFAPIAAPMQVPWGRKAFGNYLGSDTNTWEQYDASALVAKRPHPHLILIDQGDADQFLAEQLQPQKFAAAAAKSGQALNLRMQPGYDHSYYFIQSFIGDHLRHHAAALQRTRPG